MLQYGTVEQHTLDVLKGLMAVPWLNNFYLAGGTALSLYFGHRKSIDLDLFSTQEFSNEFLVSPIHEKFAGFAYRNTHNPIGLFGFVDDVKADFIKHHQHPLIEEHLVADGIRLLSFPI